MGPVFIWSAIEPSVAIVSACLPHLAPLRHVIRNKLASSLGSKNSESNPAPPWRSHHSGGGGSQKGNALFTYGGSRFNFGGDRMLKLVEADDEVGLTNRVTAGSVTKGASSTSDSDEHVNGRGIVVHSTFVQSTDTSGRRESE